MSSLGFSSKSFAVEGFEPQPVVETLWPILSRLDLKPLKVYKGVDMTEIQNIKRPLTEAAYKTFYTDKIEKILIGYQVFMKRMTIQPIALSPNDDYDFPILIAEVVENPGRVHFLLDMHPLRDLVVDEWYREKYLDPIEPIWKEYLDLYNDINPNTWFRSFLSPFPICCRLTPKDSDRSEFARLTEVLAKYLEYYVSNVIPKAEPVKDPQAKEFAVKKKNAIRSIYSTRDPGGGPLVKVCGPELAKKILLALF
jgi:hypothetical protein